MILASNESCYNLEKRQKVDIYVYCQYKYNSVILNIKTNYNIVPSIIYIKYSTF